MRIRNTATAIIAAAGLSVAGLGAFAAGPASAATASAGHRIKHPIKAAKVCTAHGQFGWTSAGQRFLCVKPWGWRHYRWVRDPIPVPAPPKPPGPVLTPAQQLQAWALATGNADWSQVFGADSAQLAADEAQTPSILTGPISATPPSITVTPSGQLQTTITADANALVTDATAALAAPPPGSFAASWNTIMTDQVNYGTLIAGDPGDWGQYTFSQPDANAAFSAAGAGDLTVIQAVPINVPAVTTIVPLTANLTLDNEVILWAEGTLGQTARDGLSNLTPYYPLVQASSQIWGGMVYSAAQSAAADPPPGTLAAPFSALATEYESVGSGVIGNGTVTLGMVTAVSADVAAWNTELAGDGPDVPTWFPLFAP
jgi:hypothetical protein